MTQARRLLLVAPGKRTRAQSGEAASASAQPEAAAKSWKDDPAMAWAVAELAGLPLPPNATLLPADAREAVAEARRAEEGLRTIVHIDVPPEVWQELDQELAQNT